MALKITLWQDVEDESDCEEEKDTGEEQSENGKLGGHLRFDVLLDTGKYSSSCHVITVGHFNSIHSTNIQVCSLHYQFLRTLPTRREHTLSISTYICSHEIT
jgi:hypothetical protein